MEYKIKDICSSFGFGVSKYYKLKESLDNSIPEQNRIEYYYNKGRNLYFTDKGFQWFSDNHNTINNNSFNCQNKKDNNSVVIYQNQVIDIYKNQLEEYKNRVEYLESENKRLLDIISVKEQRELAKDVKILGTKENNNFFSKIIDKFKNR